MRAEFERLSAIDGVTIANPPMEVEGAPAMFCIEDPDKNYIWVVQNA